jgi:hypothetical protein
LDPTWRAAVADGRVKARLAGSFGRAVADNVASIRLTFLDVSGRKAGSIVLRNLATLAQDRSPGPVPALVSDYVPKNAATMRAELNFRPNVTRGMKSRATSDSIDALELVLYEFPR